jgi:purine-binding chemotaxis protein CheW
MSREIEENNDSFLVSTFYLEDILFGIDILRVQEIIKVLDITKVYHAPDYIVGIINLRGKIVTIIDLGGKIDFSLSKINEESRIMIVDKDNEYVGLLVDRVSDVINAKRNKMMPSPLNIKGAQGRFFEGVYKSSSHLITILNVDEVLSEEGK